jgi:hypothetical protein
MQRPAFSADQEGATLMMIKPILLCLMAIFPVASTYAGSVTEADFRKSARGIPESLIASGYDKIGDLNLTKLVKEIDSIHYQVVSDREFAQGRAYLKYDVPTKTVYFPANLSLTGAEGPLVLLHESLGALGYVDDNYQISNSLYLLYDAATAPREAAAPQKLSSFFTLPEFQSSFKQPRRVGNPTNVQNILNPLTRGGSNGVGGGGDPYAELVKFRAIYYLLHVFRELKVVTDEQIVWMNNHIGLETYSTLPGDDKVIGCPLVLGMDVTIKFLLVVPSGDITKIYYPAACTEKFQLDNHVPTYVLPLAILKKMDQVYSTR